MEETDSPQSSASEGSSDRSTITLLADEVIRDMQSRKLLPSLALFADCLSDVSDRIPDTFEEQIALLRTARRSAMSHLTKAGKITFIDDLAEFTESLDRCGEMPGHTLELVITRVQQMDPFAASRYLEGIGRLSPYVRSKSPQRKLIALLGDIADPNLPFAWSDGEWVLFGDLLKRHQENLTRRFTPPVVREQAAGSRYGSGASDEDDESNQLDWKAQQVDLVFYTDVLIEIGCLDKSTTDELVARLFRYKTRAKNPAEVLKSLRYRLSIKEIHPSLDELRQAITILTERLAEAEKAAAKQDTEP